MTHTHNEGWVRVRITSVAGSAPRETGAEMWVSDRSCTGTIGGGQLEWMAMAVAREMLANGTPRAVRDIPLGPEIGQCCGGRVGLEFTRASGPAATPTPSLGDVLIFGAGHVGRALAAALAPVPVHLKVIDERADMLDTLPETVARDETALPEAVVAAAAPGSAFVIVTHDHGLDFLVTGAALARRDAAYVGLIGSATKRTRFTSWAKGEGIAFAPDALTSPIGAAGRGDKRPAVIAAHTAAEILTALQTGDKMPAGSHPAGDRRRITA